MGKRGTKVNNEGAVKELLEGKVVEFGDRQYRYSKEFKKLQYSDYGSGKWKDSNHSLEEFKNNPEVDWLVVG